MAFYAKSCLNTISKTQSNCFQHRIKLALIKVWTENLIFKPLIDLEQILTCPIVVRWRRRECI